MAITFQHLAVDSRGDVEIAGTGVRAYDVLARIKVGDGPQELAEAYRLPLTAIYEALAYATAHPDEMEAIRQANEAAQRRALHQMPEQVRDRPHLP